MTWVRLVSVAVGGAVGAVARYAISSAIVTVVRTGYPWGTFLVNAVGCFLIGLLMAGATRLHQPDLQAMLITGFLGALTTFSTFSLEAILLFEARSYLSASLYVVLSLVVGIAAVLAGGGLARALARIG